MFSNVSGLLLLLKVLQYHPTLQQKNIKHLHIDIINGDDEANNWVQLYEEYSHVMSDHTVKATGISHAGTRTLAQALHHNSIVDRLNLSNNSISGDGAVALARALHHNSTMECLDLSNNSISDTGARALAKVLHHNSTLRWLYLSNNSISDAGAVALAQALHHNSTLKSLQLHGNNAIGEEGTCALIEAMTVNTSITTDSIFRDLTLSRSCEEYALALATQCRRRQKYDLVENRIRFLSDDT